jgi:LEA14-like dessication related protein
MLLSLTTCQTMMQMFQEPVISLYSVELANVNINSVQLLCKIQVENRNSFDIPFPETDWELFINANSFVSGTVKNNQRIRANNTTIVEVPVNFSYIELFNTFRSLKGSRQAEYKVKLGVKIPLPILRDKVWQFEREGSVPMLQLPQIRTPVMRMENANITRAIINVTVNVVNPNPFEIPVPRITYDYLLNRSSFIKGNIESQTPLAPLSTTPVVFQLIVTYSDLFRSFSAMRNLFEVPALLIVTCDFGIPAFSGEAMRFEVAGTLPILR